MVLPDHEHSFLKYILNYVILRKLSISGRVNSTVTVTMTGPDKFNVTAGRQLVLTRCVSH